MIKKLATIVCIFLSSCSVYAAPDIELTSSNLINFYGEVDGQLITNTVLAIENNKSPTIYLYINSPGGSVLDGVVLVNYLLNTKKKVVCIAEYAASMAHAILQACPIRYGTVTNILLQHKPSVSASGSPTEIEGTLNILKGIEDLIGRLESKRIGVSLEEFKKRTFHPWVTFGEESIKQNRIDDLVDVTCSPELYQKSTKKEVKSIFARGIVTTSACPLLSPTIEIEDK